MHALYIQTPNVHNFTQASPDADKMCLDCKGGTKDALGYLSDDEIIRLAADHEEFRMFCVFASDVHAGREDPEMNENGFQSGVRHALENGAMLRASYDGQRNMLAGAC